LYTTLYLVGADLSPAMRCYRFDDTLSKSYIVWKAIDFLRRPH
jgi:hypothetical protein